MSTLSALSRRALQCAFLALVMLFAQQAAQLHALAHAQDELAQQQKGKPASHAFERCLAYHALDSALTAGVALHDFDFFQSADIHWVPTEAPAPGVYRLPSRAPPRSA